MRPSCLVSVGQRAREWRDLARNRHGKSRIKWSVRNSCFKSGMWSGELPCFHLISLQEPSCLCFTMRDKRRDVTQATNTKKSVRCSFFHFLRVLNKMLTVLNKKILIVRKTRSSQESIGKSKKQSYEYQ